jgi:hypothetical protein
MSAIAPTCISTFIDVVERPNGVWLSYVDWDFRDTTLYLAEPMAGGQEHRHHMLDDHHGPGWQSALFFDEGVPLVAYTVGFKKQIRLAQPKGMVWAPSPPSEAETERLWEHSILLEDAGNFVGHQNQAKGDIVIAYEDITLSSAGRGTVGLLRRRNGTWTKSPIDTEGPCGDYMTMAVNSRGEVLLAYHCSSIRGIKLYDETSTPAPQAARSR